VLLLIHAPPLLRGLRRRLPADAGELGLQEAVARLHLRAPFQLVFVAFPPWLKVPPFGVEVGGAADPELGFLAEYVLGEGEFFEGEALQAHNPTGWAFGLSTRVEVREVRLEGYLTLKGSKLVHIQIRQLLREI
jgi:hypothetical protein